MKPSIRKTRATKRLLAFGLIFVFSGIALAANWSGFTSFARTVSGGLFGAPENSAGTNPESRKAADNFTIGTCDTAGPIEIESSGGTTTPTAYATLKDSFDAINAGTHTGTIRVEVCGNTTETATAALNASGSGSASYTAITISPAGGAARTISGDLALPLVDFNGADNVTVDGLNTGGNSLTIANVSVSATSGTATIRFIGGATNNTITNSNIQGSATMSVATNGATIFFSTDGVTANGNDNNTISNNNIGPAGANLPTKGILCNGSTTTTAIGNSGNIVNNNNIFDYFGAAVTSSGIASNGGCNTWTITNNRFYQTGTRTWTTGATHRAIDIGNSTSTSGAQGFTITGNIVGYASNTQTGTYTLTGSTGKFQGIQFNGITGGTVSTISNNTVANVSLTGVTSSGTSTSSPFMGMLITNGLVTSSNNTIGSQSATGNMVFSTNSTTSTDIIGIYNFSVDNWTAAGNNIGGISVTNAAASGTFVIYGMRANTSTTVGWTGTSNTIGGTVADSIQLNATGASSQIIGMHTSNAAANFSQNTIRNLTTNIGTGTTTSASLIGINVTTSTPNHTLSQNTIFNLNNTNTTAASVVSGIQFTGGTANVVERNLVYGLSAATNSTAAEVNGIRVAGGTTVYRNNMIAFGAGIPNAIGTGSTTGGVNGINEPLGTDSFFHNSVYVGGAPTAGVGPSYAFNSSQTVNTRSFRDNIFVNARNNSGATGKNYIVRAGGSTPNPTGLTINNNVYFSSGAGAVFGFFNSLDVADLNAWKTAVGQDAASFFSDPQFVAPTASTPNLHLSPSVSTVAEGNGSDVGVTNDYDNETRASLTPVDIGADAGNFMGVDLSAPSISYTNLGNTSSTVNRTLTVTITDVTAVATGGNAPRIYFNKNAGTYFSTACTLATGTTQNGTWDCLIDYSLAGGAATADVFRYFVVAQDTLGNLAANPSGGFSGTNVNTVTTPPTTPNQYSIVTAYTGTYSVGGAETITSLTNTGGLFDLINNGVVSGNLVINLTSDLTAETGTVALNQTAEEGAGNWTILFQASGGPRLISGSNTTALINLNGADRVTFSGLASGPYGITIRNTSATTGAAVQMTNDASNNGILNCIVEGGNTSTSSALILIATGVTTGNDNNTISDSIVRDRTDAAGVPANAVASLNASTTAKNSNTVVTNNLIQNFINNGIATSSGATSENWTITNNELTQNAARAAATFGINTGGMAGTNTISGNKIHGFSNTGSNTVLGILVGNSLNLTVSRNQIYDFQTVSGATGLIEGIEYDGASGGTPSLTIVNNYINLQPTVSNAQSVIGIQDFGFGGNVFTANYNTIYIGGTATGSSSWAMRRGTAAPTTFTARNNLLFNNRTGGTGSHFAGGDQSANTGTFVCNYNFYAGTGATAASFMDYGTSSTGTPVSFAAWQTGPPTRDANSTGDIAANFTVANIFVDAANNNLHLKSTAPASILGAGTPVGGVTTDFDGDTRDGATPDIGADELVPGTLAFSTGSYSVGEAGGTVTLTVTRTGGTDGAVSVDYATANGTATGGASCGGSVDYVSAAGTLNFASGEASKTFAVTICNDAVYEGNEDFTSTLSNATGGATIGTPNPTTVTIQDDEMAMPGTLALSSATYGVGEAAGTATLTVNRTGGSDGAVSVGYSLTDATATGGAACGGSVDYVNTGGTVNFANGETVKTFNVTICNDAATEPAETFTATLSGPTGGATLGSPAAAIVTITDDDVPAGPVTVTATAGTPGPTSYPTLKDAFDAINAGTHQGTVAITIAQDTTETASAVLNESGSGSASYTSVSIQPAGGAARTVSGNVAGHLIDFNGADNVTINGLNTGGNSLTISNTSQQVGASTIRFAADASNNTVTNSTLTGSTGSVGSSGFGVVYFGTGTVTGNDNNTISNNNITAAGANLPINGIYSMGTSAAIDNSGNTVSGNNISDFFNTGAASNGIQLNSGNSGWTISNNKLFQTGTRTYTTAATHNGINVLSGSAYTITGNTIGYAAANGTGVYTMAGTIATRFIGINLAVGTTGDTSVQGNTVASISLATSSGAATTNGVLCGLNITSGNVNVGTVTPNTFGATTGTGSLSVVSTTTQAAVVGINSGSTNTVVISNNTFGAFTSASPTAAVAGAVFGINVSGAATSMTITGNTIGNATADNMRAGILGTTTGSSLAGGINQTAVPAVSNYSNNTIRNLSSYGTGTGGNVRGIQTSTVLNTTAVPTINGNTITNLTTSGAVSGQTSANTSALGIQLISGTGASISGNTISNISNINTSTAGTVVAGITHASAINTTIANNVIYGLSNASTATSTTLPGVIAGVLIRSGTTNTTVQNNMISLGTGQATNSAIFGIWGNHGSTPDPADKIYFNTVNIEGTVTSGAQPSAAFHRGDLTTTAKLISVDVRNNIFNNSRTGGTGKHYAIANHIGAAASSATGWTTVNNNVLNSANPATVGFWTTDQTFAGWKSVSGGDNLSFSGVPVTFVNSASNLHLNMGVTPTVLESNGATIPGLTTDIDGQTRPGPAGSTNGGAFAPDLGADEFDGVYLDGTPPAITYTTLVNTTSTANRTLAVNVTDSTGVASGGSSPRVYFKKTTDASYVSTACTFASGTPQNGSYNCLIDYSLVGGGAAVTGDTIQYFVVAQDTVGNVSANPSIGFSGTNVNTVTTPPTTPNSYVVSVAYSGPYTVGSGGSFASLTNPGGVFEAINNGVLSGSVTIDITSDLTGETGSIALNQPVEEGMGGYTITIKPSGAARSITSTGTATAVIKISDADRVTIDGSLSGGTDRSLTITNANTAASTAAIWIASATNGAQNNTIKNTILAGGADQSVTNTFNFGIISSSSASILTGGVDNDNNTYSNNFIRKVSVGIASIGGFATNMNQNTTISNNLIGPAAFGSDEVSTLGILIFNENAPSIVGNELRFIGDAAISGGSSGRDHVGISLCTGSASWSGTAAATQVGTVTNGSISRNLIHDIVERGTFSAVGIVNNCANGGNPTSNTIANNMIYGIQANGTSPDQTVGIGISNGNGDKVVFNSVFLTGDIDPGAATSSAISSFGISLNVATPTNLTLSNNNVVMDLSSNTTTLLNAAINIPAGYVWGTGGSNYNNLYAPAMNVQSRVGATGGSGGTFYPTLAAWQTATTQDANSVSVDPLFVSATDLHIQSGSPMTGVGSAVAGVTVDFDGQTRDATPDIGADELVPGTLAFSTGSYSVGEAGGTVTLTVTRTGGTDGAVSVDYATANGTATGGASCGGSVDYVSAAGTLNFASGEASKTFNVTICNDAVYEGNEDFTSTLSNATGGATIGTPNPTTVTIQDDEMAMPGTLALSSATYGVGEAAGTATLTVNRTGGSDGAVSVDYATADGTATGGASCGGSVDYVSATGTLNFANGETVKTFNVTICNDMTVESAETFTATLSNATGGATLGSPSSATVTITDDDTPASPVSVTATAGTASGSYNNLTDAVAAINAGTHQGDIVVSVNQSVTEPASVVLNSNGAGSALYSSILIRPTADGLTVSGPTVTGRGLIELNGADNVTIDGDNPNTAGTNRNLTLQNTAANTVTFTSVIRVALATTIVTSADNCTFRNLNIAGSATGRNISTATSTTGSENTTFGIVATAGASTVSATTAPSALASVTTTIGTGATAANMLISNNAITTAARAISVNGAATTVFPGLQIKDNRIGNQTAGAADQVYSIGITAQGAANGLISGNTVWVEGFVASSAATHGINVGVISTAATFTIENNKVNRARNLNGATWSAFGINLGGGSNHIVQNNFVSGVMNDQTAGTGAFGTTFGAYGIRVASGTGHKIYHNSVNLYGAMGGVTSTDLTAAFMVVATTQTGLDVRNNVFANQITGGNPTGTRNVSVYLPSAATSAMNLTLNNNANYSSTDANSRLAQTGTTFGTGEFTVANFDPTQTTPSTNFRAYTSTLSAAGTNDNASFASASAPPFTSNVDLHIPAATATRLESGGAAVGVLTDIDLDMRNPTTPDIGADEFAGQPAPPNDLAATVLNVPANGANVPLGAAFSPQATFLNNGTAAQTNVTVRYKIIDGSMMEVYNQTAVIPSINPLQSVTVTFPSTSLSIAGTYTIQAIAELTGDTNPANDSISGTVTGVPPLTGSYDVGTGQTYTSLTNPGGIFQALNANGISGNVTINITSDLTGETGAVMLNQLSEVGAGNYTVTIKPSGAARTISGTSAATSGLIILNGADRITIDGSLMGGTDRSLTITNNQATTGVVIWMRSPNSSNGATNNTIKNCIINGAPGPGSTTVAGILTGSGTTLGNDAEAPNSNNTVQNNWIYRVQNSLYLRGGTTAPVFDQNWVVTGNELGTSVVNDKNLFRGMLIGNSSNFTITNNFVHGIQSSTTTASAMNGIQLALLVSGGTVTGNVISDIKNVSSSGTGAYGLTVSSTSAASNVTIANNFISDVTALGSATATSNGFGMMFSGSGTGYNVYFNSVNMNTNQSTAGTTAALHVNSTFATAGALNVRNNVFANTQTTGTRYAVYSTAAANVFTAIDYNDYFAANVGFLGSARVTLADWQTATGQDANSKAVDPVFVSSTNLHLQPTSPVINMAVTGTGIATDIDGDPRGAQPDMGADEAAVPGTLAFSSATYSVGEAGGTVTLTVNRTGGSDGAVSAAYSLGGGTATGGAACGGSVDYVNTGGTVSFANGETVKTFNVTVCDDSIYEGNETFNATLSSPTGGAVLGTPNPATVTIVENDTPAGSFSVNDVRVVEGNSGTTNMVFTVTFTGSNSPTSVQYATANGTATAGVDYTATSGTLSFPPTFGSTVTLTQTVTVPIIGDTVKEPNETLFLNLSNAVNATIADAQGVGIIVDNDRSYVADFDRDLNADFSVFRPSEGLWYVLQSTNATPKIVPLGTNGDRPVPGDYDADGYADYAVYRPSSGTWFVMLSSNSSMQIYNWGIPGDLPVQGDYDGDGKTDIAIYRPASGEWWVTRSSDNGTYAVQFGISTDKPVQGDYDGDGKTDIAVYRDGTWYVLNSSNASVSIVSWGLPTDKPVSGDFDGDGRYDLAVFRDGDWWVISSLTGAGGSFHWGQTGDVPAAADFDHDGTTDYAVFRPASGDWYVWKSSNGQPIVIHWGLNGDIPAPSAYLPQ